MSLRSEDWSPHGDLQPLRRYNGGTCAGCAGLIIRDEAAVRIDGDVFHAGCATQRDELRRIQAVLERRRKQPPTDP